jgi:aminopeptidase N
MLQKLTKLHLALLILLLVSCQGKTDTYHLTQKEAESRASLLSNIKYTLSVNLGNAESFEGKVEIKFHVWKSTDIRLDYFQGKLASVILNDVSILDKIVYTNGFFNLPSSFVKKGDNHLVINFATPYSKTGNGLHKFIDPDDKEVYIYSQFEAFHANKMFPCFDQPDLKATYKLTAEAPKTWKVISSNLQTSIQPSIEHSDFSIHSFPETEKFSTYVFSLHAGPYQEFEDKYNSIPLKLYVRKSLAKYVDSKDWFRFTKEGFSFFEGYFAIPYPFSKYDQIIVPEFNFGAMENVGAVTFSERFVSRSPMTRAQRENLSDVILHEMAHMWFGNLVTMRWWNGLWLNESFATYMASLAQERSSEFRETWESFFEKMKQWAYEEDSYSTNHPIEANVLNTEEAFTQFDGITYGKGASVIKQLVFFIGEDTFQRGVQNYLKRYSYSNSTLKDFLFELELASGINLKKWSKDWLEAKGTNEIEFVSECSDGYLKWKVIQYIPGSQNRYRDHKINIGAYTFQSQVDSQNESLPKLAFESFPIVYTGRSTSYVQKLKQCPDYILVNSEDQDFVIWKWTEFPLEKLKFILTHDTSSFRKLMLWTAIDQQIELGKISYDQFYLLAVEMLPKEQNLKVKKWLISRLSADNGISYFTSRFWLDDTTKKRHLESLSNFLWKGLLAEKESTDAQKYWFLGYLDATYHATDQERIWNLYTGKNTVPGLKIDQDQRWAILKKLSSLGFNSNVYNSALIAEQKLDPSSRGVNSSYAIEAISPNLDTKSKWFNTLLKPKESQLSSSTLRVVAYNLFPVNQKDLQLPFFKSYLESLANFDSFEDENYLDGFAKSLAPNFCTRDSRLILTKFVNSHPSLPASIRKTLHKQVDLETRCLLIRQKTLESANKKD